MADSRIYVCKDCKTMVMLINKGGCEPSCCGKAMEQLVANTVDAAKEKHVPAVKVEGNRITVEVGSVAHPMTEAHLIEWIFRQTQHGGQYRYLTPSDEPKAVFEVADGEKPLAVYEYCNLHGLWKADI